MSALQVATSPREVEDRLLSRWPESKLEPSLARVRLLTDLLGQPQRAFETVHITGTNGKTSTARMIEALLDELGHRVGRFTSPHLTDVRERISLDAAPIGEQRFVETYAAVAAQALHVDASSDIPLSFFEMTVAMTYEAFATYGVDAAVVEVGMGGRWDATNVVDGKVAVFLPVALDHTDYLGPTVLDIAAEKAGIIKPGAVAVSARQDGRVEQLLGAHAEANQATLLVEDRDFALTRRRASSCGQIIGVNGLAASYDDLPLALHGQHQAHNAAVAIASVEAFCQAAIPRDVVYRALSRVESPGRLEVLHGDPTVLLDAAHNPDAARALAGALADLGPARTVGVVGMMADKDHQGVLATLESAVDILICTRNSSDRSMAAPQLAASARDVFGPERVRVVDNLADALEAARRVALDLAGDDALDARVLVTGSVVTVGDAMNLLAR